MPPNNHRTKNQERYYAHNRKPGHAKFWKRTRNRKSRRFGARISRMQVEGKVNIN